MEIKKRIKKVVLVYPNQKWMKVDLTTTWNLPPNTLCLLGTMIEDLYEVKIIDANFYDLTEEQFEAEIREFKPDVVGISLLTSEYQDILEICVKLVKEIDHEIVTVAGGVHVTTQHESVLEDQNIDYAVRGEGEYVFRNLLEHLNGRAEFPKKGMVFRNCDGKIEAFEPELIADLDQLPIPNYKLVDYPAYANKLSRYGVDSVHVKPFARILTSRGCPVGCSFCQVESISGKSLRMRSAENVIAELQMLKNEYGIEGFVIEDDNPFGNKKRTKKMLRLLKEANLNLTWKAAGVTIFNMDEEIFELMAETGCQAIGIAIESGVERVLKKIIRKPVNLKKVPDLVKLAQKYGLFVTANFIVGFPGETWEEIRETLHYAETCGVDYIKVYQAQPLLGTRLYDEAIETKSITGTHDKVGWRYSRLHTSEFSPKDLSVLRVYEWDRINFSTLEKREKAAKIMNIDLEELARLRKATRNSLTFEDMDMEMMRTREV
ncbi:MAG: hypothetical protein CMM60_08620 [Rhodospirillaceae bacterium]|jgi:radical SAM superfamily enzyme YgiQ (UPF0313 family)|nr:hypothetical protein [Rhodospirillaceae bacterium]|tara:strand:- start:2744 stop:4213 length:1470 start_codon:yes stop_codon:yes gene_type:complete